MFLSFLIIYKKNLSHYVKKHNLNCSSRVERYFIKHIFSLNKYVKYLRKGESVPLRLAKKIEAIQNKYMLDCGLAKDIREKSNVTKNNLEESLCRWLALAKTIGVNPYEYVTDMMEEVEVPILSQRYLNNKLRVS